MKTIEIPIPEGKKAEWVNDVLTLVDEKPQFITDRIKTFEDAYKWCEENHRSLLTAEHDMVKERWGVYSYDLMAYLKLRIITAALNEGWEPEFSLLDDGENGYRQYVPCIPFENGKGHCESRAYHGVPPIPELAIPGVKKKKKIEPDPLKLLGIVPQSLIFKSSHLALYAVTQFRDIYADFCGCKKGGEK